jgi:hypothetical protein
MERGIGTFSEDEGRVWPLGEQGADLPLLEPDRTAEGGEPSGLRPQKTPCRSPAALAIRRWTVSNEPPCS